MKEGQTIYFIRHGQTDGNLNHLVQGITDTPLNETGISQAHKAKESFDLYNVNYVIASPLLRTKKTAEIVTSDMDLNINFHPNLIEMNFGRLENVCSKSLEEPELEFLWRDIVDIIRQDFFPKKYQVESLDSVKTRVAEVINDSLQNCPSPILIVSHFVIHLALCEILNVPYYEIDNCGLDQFIFQDNKWLRHKV